MNRVVSILLACATLTIGLPTAQGQIVQSLQSGGDRLVDTQDQVGGGWTFYADDPDPTAAPNIVGPIAIGLARAYAVTQDPDHRAALELAGSFLQNNPRFHTWDGLLAQSLDQALGVNTYVPLMQQRYATLNTAQFMLDLEAFRASQGFPNLSAWDYGIGIASARAIVPGQESVWIQATKNKLESIASPGAYDVLALAGAVYGLATVGDTTYDPQAGIFQGANSLTELGDLLAGYQVSSTGGVLYQTDADPLVPGNENVQETAYTIFALNALDRAGYFTEIDAAAQFLYGSQLPNGGWQNYAFSPENNEVTGEALWGIVTVVPEPSTYALLALAAGVGGFVLRRRRSAQPVTGTSTGEADAS